MRNTKTGPDIIFVLADDVRYGDLTPSAGYPGRNLLRSRRTGFQHPVSRTSALEQLRINVFQNRFASEIRKSRAGVPASSGS